MEGSPRYLIKRGVIVVEGISGNFAFWVMSAAGEILGCVVLGDLMRVAVSADDQHLLRCEPARFVLLPIVLNKHSPFLLFLLIQL